MQDGINPEILFEDNKILVAIKQPGMLSQSDFTSRPDLLSQLKDHIKLRDKKPGNVFLGLLHRLDKEVGGIMVFAKNSKSAKQMSELIRNHEFHKKYQAIVNGINLPSTGVFEDYLVKNSKNNFVKVTDKSNKGAKLSTLKYKVLEHFNDNYLVEIELLTGRSHQIRVQFAHRGYPLKGDKKYSSQKSMKNSIALWASEVSFIHPATGKEVCFKSKPPFTLL